MNTRRLQVITAVLAVVTIGLAITLGMVLANDDKDEDAGSLMGMGNGSSGDSFMGMMMSMGAQDSDAMLGHMEDILGEEGFGRMMQHLQDHRDGAPMTGNAEADEMMHRMMDGMMQHMPTDTQNILPPDVDQHHEPPVAGTPSS